MMARKIVLIAGWLLLGMVLGAVTTGFLLVAHFSPPSTVVYSAEREFRLENGAVLPAGTQLIHRRSASEGFQSLCLGVNVGGEQQALFRSRVEPRRELFIPYWVTPEGQP